MKIKFTLFLTAFAIVGTLSLFMLSQNKSLAPATAIGDLNVEAEEEEEMSKETRIEKAMEQEFEMTRDLSTNEVPRERLLQAKRYMGTLQIAAQERASVPLVWEERGPDNVAGRTRAILMDMNDPTGKRVFAGGVGGGLWRTDDIQVENPTWVPIDDFFDNIAIVSMAQDPSNPDLMYFGTGEGFFNADAIRGLGIWKSSNGGLDWEQLPSTNNSSFRYVQKIVINDQGEIFAGTRAGLFKSFDQGASWDLRLGEDEENSLTDRVADIEIASDGDIYAAMGLMGTDGIYKSENNGSSWEKLTTDLPFEGYERIEIGCAPSNPERVYALFQDGGSNGCSFIFRTDNGGENWTSVTVPDALGMDNFARNQAWYDLSIGVDPNNEDRVFIGGVDLHATTDGGNNWVQVSQWFGGAGMQYVHADQHTVVFKPGSSDIALFGNDGGVFYTENASSFIPTIENRNSGYNVTQYYACAMRPEAGSNVFLAGAQDNGTQKYEDPGMNSTVRVTGGDGMFCHIDQENGNVQITSYVYNNYRVSLNGGNGFENRNYDDTGRFVNPTDYDSNDKNLYCAMDSGKFLRWNDPDNAGFDFQEVDVDAFGNGQVSNVTVSPNVPHRVYFGLGSGNIVRVDDAHLGTSIQGVTIFDGSGYISGIDIEEGNEDHIILSFSNYGQESILETTDGGGNWTSVEGNLPDMPVRWVIFSPNNNDGALIATELGVWTTTDLNGADTEWEPSNANLANVRVDMLQTRSSDDMVIAATHGRGLFSTGYFSTVSVDFEEVTSNYQEGNSNGNTADCRFYEEVEIPVIISRSPDEDLSLAVSANANSTAVEGQDYDFVDTEVSFTPNGAAETTFTIRIYEDRVVEGPETIILDLVSTENLGLNFQHTITIEDNDSDPKLRDGQQEATIGVGASSQFKGPFGGFAPDSKTQILYTAEELTAQGLVRGAIVSLAFDVVNKVSAQPFAGFTIAMKNTSSESLNGETFETDMATVYTGTVTTTFGWNKFDFSSPFIWDGSSNVLVSICFDNETWTLDDRVAATTTDVITMTTHRSYTDVGCELSEVKATYTLRPDIRFVLEKDIAIEMDLTDAVDAYLHPEETAHFYSANGKVMASIKQMPGATADLGCVSVRIDRAGTGQDNPSWLNGFAVSEKTFFVDALNEEDYEITLYYTEEEMAIWGDDKTKLHILKTTVPVASASLADASLRTNPGINTAVYGATNNVCYRGTFKSFSGFALTNVEGIITSTETPIVAANGFSFYPNPARDFLQVDFASALKTQHQLVIFDVNGKQLYTTTLATGAANATLKLEALNLTSGMYFLRLENNTGLQEVKRFIIAK